MGHFALSALPNVRRDRGEMRERRDRERELAMLTAWGLRAMRGIRDEIRHPPPELYGFAWA